MSIKQKMDFIQNYVVCDCYCIWDLFCENVTEYGAADFKMKVKNATTEKELKSIVHEYI